MLRRPVTSVLFAKENDSEKQQAADTETGKTMFAPFLILNLRVEFKFRKTSTQRLLCSQCIFLRVQFKVTPPSFDVSRWLLLPIDTRDSVRLSWRLPLALADSFCSEKDASRAPMTKPQSKRAATFFPQCSGECN